MENIYNFYKKAKKENRIEDTKNKTITYNIEKLRNKIYTLSDYDFMSLYGILSLKNNPDRIDIEITESIKSYFKQYPENFLN